MKRTRIFFALLLAAGLTCLAFQVIGHGAGPATWHEHSSNPLIGGKLGTCFDPFVIKDDGKYKMWFSWRHYLSIAYTESSDGLTWSQPKVVLWRDPSTGWENQVNRGCVVKREGRYLMWYTGRNSKAAAIGFATSPDGLNWTRMSRSPVLRPELDWEKTSVMCPHVIWDDKMHAFRMWYSGGELGEPDDIGHAVSRDGLHWERSPRGPIFLPAGNSWEAAKVAACFVVNQTDWYYMFYIGFHDLGHACIGLARSHDGLTGWERFPGNPIIHPGGDRTWDHDAVYKPSVLFDHGRWYLWFNGRGGRLEQIGLATLDSPRLWER